MRRMPAASGAGVAVLSLLSLNACEVREGTADSPLNWTFTPTLRLGSTSGADRFIQVFEGGTRTRLMGRPIEAAVVNREVALERIGEGTTVGVAGKRCRLDPVEELETRGFEEQRQVVSAIRVDGAGWIWVRRHAAPLSEPDRFVTDVFDLDGVYRGTLPEGSPWPATFTADGRVIALETDELGIQSFVVCSVGRTGA